jgi:Fe-S oxidoreductase
MKPVEDESFDAFLQAMEKVLQEGNYGVPLSIFADLCTGCLRCADQCQVFQASGEARDVPHSRTEEVIRIYREFFHPRANGWFSRRKQQQDIREQFNLRDLNENLYRCTLCRRCTEECPMGIDHRLVARFGRQVLSEMGIVPQNMGGSTHEQIFGIGNTSAFPRPAIIDALEFLEEDTYDTYGLKCTFPQDKEGAEYLIFHPVSDYMMEAETLMGIGIVMDLIGHDWSVSTYYADAINYGLFFDDGALMMVLDKMVQETKRLKAKKVVIGECGHATRSALGYWKSHFESEGIEIMSILQVTAEALRQGKLSPKREKNPQKIVLHDPCNIVRGCGIITPQREILEACSMDYVEMKPNGVKNYCGGGGGSIVICEDLEPFRNQVAGKVKADQIKVSGAEMVCAPCANCKKMLRELVDHHKLPVTVIGLHDLLAKSLMVEAPQDTAPTAA